jgi:uncharacterized LabA/DUF88 family protein
MQRISQPTVRYSFSELPITADSMVARMATNSNLALLIDADNVSAKIIVGLMAEIANYGTASVRRIYGDWTSPALGPWKACLLNHSITPIQQFAYTSGKNATDGAMIIDAMDLLYTGRYSAFCIVSSDSDFTRLASRIREQAVTVYGFGERKTPHAFVAACNKFTYFDVLNMTFEEPAAADRQSQAGVSLPYRERMSKGLPDIATGVVASQLEKRPLNQAAIQALARAITDSRSDDDDWVNLAVVGLHLSKLSPDVHPRNYGYQRLREFAEASGIVELKVQPMGEKPPVSLVRLKERMPVGVTRREVMREV